MHNHTFRLQDIAPIVEQKTGKTIADGDLDGRYDAEVVILHDADLADLESKGVDANTVYFGDLVINSYDSGAISLRFQLNGLDSLKIIASLPSLPVGNIQPCVMFDEITDYVGSFCTFYGWKITLNP